MTTAALTPPKDTSNNQSVAEFRGLLHSLLQQGEVTVTFDKVNGDERVMLCTLDPDKIPPTPIVEGKTAKKKSESVMAVYDVNAAGWRSFVVERVKKVEFAI